MPALAGLPSITRRDLRLASGLVLFVYIATHLSNHALGLVSLDAAERGLGIAVRVWHSRIGTLVLYGAAATHVVLALQAIYQRRTLRMPPLELLRLVAGISIPTLLISHAVQTRVAMETFELSTQYQRVVWELWTAGDEGRQLAMMVPGWLHGCLGLHFAFGQRRSWQRIRLPLFAIALLLPVLGGLGFLAMGKEIAMNVELRGELDALVALDDTTRNALLRLRDGALAVYFGAVAIVFGARLLRAYVERRRGSLVRIAFPQADVEVPRGWTVLEASRAHHLPHVATCGGRARCSTCRVRVTAGAERCAKPEPDERAMLERIGAPSDVRLACQLQPEGSVSVVPLLTAAPASLFERARDDVAFERNLALVAVRWRNRAEFVERQMPQDVVYATRLFRETVATALRAAGGDELDAAADRVVAAFGLAEAFAPSCRAALAVAERLEPALSRLQAALGDTFATRADFALCVHAGQATIAWTGAGDARRALVAGAPIDALDRLEGGTGFGCTVVTAAALAGAERDDEARACGELSGVAARVRSRGAAA